MSVFLLISSPHDDSKPVETVSTTEHEAVLANFNALSDVKLEEFINSGTGILYFGSPTCPWCNKIAPILLEIQEETGIMVNYYNPSSIRDDIPAGIPASDLYKVILEKFDEYLQPYTNDEGKAVYNEKRLYIPDVYLLDNGTIIDHHYDTLESDEEAQTALTDSQKKELKDIYLEMFQYLKNK